MCSPPATPYSTHNICHPLQRFYQQTSFLTLPTKYREASSLILLQCIKEPKNSLLILSYNGLWSLATFALFSGACRIYGALQLSGATDGVVGVATNLLQCYTKFQHESHLEACGDVLSLQIMMLPNNSISFFFSSA
jgi:hypothetical protein